MTNEDEDVTARLGARGAFPMVPDHWLPHLDRLDRALAAIDPDYTVSQVKGKYDGLRFYLPPTLYEAPCCELWLSANPSPGRQDVPAWKAWFARQNEHEQTIAHERQAADWRARRAAMHDLISIAERESYTW
ncbi:hypothetical protein [Streptacidiphilus sp. P02-A3a]|uniref:hypothetical protein n=1 Tax=Streptacidiphilus sp. P02-A3a TaxID=2704468 RepID=UPI0015FAA7E6|nr:hypothetical protein [Streptacidiphilus sp. P02-A3a]QMU68406.1 hypothetical protein GXP74_09390 [Streptacidiphilus sp. P02-A3a]